MNRKQKVAVVVGVVVVVLLVLFPPWRSRNAYAPECDRPIAVRWIGSDAMVAVPMTTYSGSDALDVMSVDSREAARTFRVEDFLVIPAGTPSRLEYTLAWGPWVALLTAALTLTVAAVVVLKERKG